MQIRAKRLKLVPARRSQEEHASEAEGEETMKPAEDRERVTEDQIVTKARNSISMRSGASPLPGVGRQAHEHVRGFTQIRKDIARIMTIRTERVIDAESALLGRALMAHDERTDDEHELQKQKTRQPSMSPEPRTQKVGRVVSDKMDKTVVVAVDYVRRHRLYHKRITRTSKFKAHDEQNECKTGDIVRIEETRPMSKNKHWIVREISSAPSRSETDATEPARSGRRGNTVIQPQTRLRVADNSGAREIMCIRVLGGSSKKYGSVGDIIIAAVKQAQPNAGSQEGRCRPRGHRADGAGVWPAGWQPHQVR